ncbi:MAG: 7-cyano-7-deazaguanine synthase [Nitrososphaerales archaeon]
MCSINGLILFDKERDDDELLEIEDKLRALIIRAEDRGRDSYGIVSFESDKSVRILKEKGPPSQSLHEKSRFITPKTTIVINNNRAEPTTEFVREKLATDIQPLGDEILVSHNGIIANDNELQERYHLTRDSKIDTSVLPPLLESLWKDDRPIEGLVKVLREVVGSFALAIVDRMKPEYLYLACNYKPISLEYDVKHQAMLFTSLEEYFEGNSLFDGNPTRQLKPYTALVINTSKEQKECGLLQEHKRNGRKALAICSGGLDSTIAAKVANDEGYDITLLHFNYRHRAEAKEVQAVERIAEALACELLVVETDLFRDVIGSSNLVSKTVEVNKGKGGESGAEFASEWVPARNLVFLSIAVGIAESKGYDSIILGNNLEESGSYPDNEMIFIDKLNQVLPYATNLGKQVTILMPLGNLVKHEIVKRGLEVGAPMHETWSCYEGGEIPCNSCGPDFMRRHAFRINKVIDPTASDLGSIFWKGCEKFLVPESPPRPSN